MTAAPTEANGLRQRGKRRRIQRIIDAARELLREHPQQSPSLERIADRAEVAPATVFNLVGTRDHLWAAIADQALAQLAERLSQDPPADPRQRAHHIAATLVEIIRGDPDVYRHVLSHWVQSGRLLRRDPTASLLACLDQAQRDGHLHPDVDTARLAETVATACTGAVHQWAARIIDDRAFEARCRDAVDVAFAAGAAAAHHAELTRPLRRSP